MNRTKATTKNIIWGIASKIISLILSFISRTIFIRILGNELLGVNSLYTEILSMLSLVELGFGTAFTFSMYKPIKEDNVEKIRQLLSLFKKIYYVVAAAVLVIGLCLVPFLQFIVKGADTLSLIDLRLFFIIFLANTSINYLVQYKTTYVNAKMESYVVTNIEIILNFIIVLTQCLIIVVFKNYLAYLLIHTFLLFASRVAVAVYLNRKYPILKEKPKKCLDEESKKEIYKEVRGLALQNFANVAIHSTDNLIISMISGLGVIGVALVSNYNIVITSVVAFITIALAALTPGFGNLVASSSQEHYKNCFDEVNFYDFWIYGFCSIAFFVLIPPFISLWLGDDYLIELAPFVLIVLNVYFEGQCAVYNNARNAKGNFNLDKWVSVAQATINLIVSIVCAYYLGLLGVYIGTIVSRLFYVIMRPLRTYKFLYGVSVAGYYKDFIKYFLVTIATGAVTYFLCQQVFTRGVIIQTFLIACALVACVPNLLFLMVFYKSPYLKLLIERIKNLRK